VLGRPDGEELYEEAQSYDTLLQTVTPLRIADAPENGRAWLLSLDGEWFECTVEYIKRVDGSLNISRIAQSIEFGVSGSPVISDDGKAIGAVCLGSSGQFNMRNPRLVRDLPKRFLQARRNRQAVPNIEALDLPPGL
jgi:hypothetical protein